MTPPRVLGYLTGREPVLELPHIDDDWWGNVLMKKPS